MLFYAMECIKMIAIQLLLMVVKKKRGEYLETCRNMCKCEYSFYKTGYLFCFLLSAVG